MRKSLGVLVVVAALAVQTFAARVPFTAKVQQFTGGATRAYVSVVLKSCTDASGNAVIARAAGYTPPETVLPTQNFPADAAGQVTTTVIPNADLTCGITTGQSHYQVEVWAGSPTDAVCSGTQTTGCRKRVFYDQYQISGSFELATAAPFNGTATPATPNAVLTNPAGSQTIVQPVGSTLAVQGGTVDLSQTTCIGCGTGGGGSSTTLKTNGVNNASQSTLNLQSGAGTTASNPSGANVQVDVNYGTSANTAAQGNDSRITGAAQKASNLGDLADAAASRSNLGLGTAATKNVPASGNAAAGEAVLGSDTRLSDARTPTAHASTHVSAGSDPLTLTESQITNLGTDLAAKEASANKNQANGYAGLNGSSKLTASQLPLPGASSLGGVQAKTCLSTDKISAIGTDGIPVCTADQTGAAGGGITTLNGSTQASQSFVDGAGVHVSTNTGTGAHTIALNFTFTTETPSGTVNGSNATFTLANAPVAGSLNLFINGFRLTQGSGYTLSGSTITYQAGYIPNSGDTHEATYRW